MCTWSAYVTFSWTLNSTHRWLGFSNNTSCRKSTSACVPLKSMRQLILYLRTMTISNRSAEWISKCELIASNALTFTVHPLILASGWSFCTCPVHCWYFCEVAKLSFCQIPQCHPQQARKRGRYPNGRPGWDINKQHKIRHAARKCHNNSHHNRLRTCVRTYIHHYTYVNMHTTQLHTFECHKYYVTLFMFAHHNLLTLQLTWASSTSWQRRRTVCTFFSEMRVQKSFIVYCNGDWAAMKARWAW